MVRKLASPVLLLLVLLAALAVVPDKPHLSTVRAQEVSQQRAVSLRGADALQGLLARTVPGLPQSAGPDAIQAFPADGTAPYAVATVFVPLVCGAQEEVQELQIFDEDGVLRDWAWLIENFGAVDILRADEPGAARIIALHASTGPAALVAHVEQADGAPSVGTTVVRYWPGAPSLSDPELHGCGGLALGVYGGTEANGNIGFGMGGGDYYWPPAGGASAIWVGRMASDCVTGLGMIGGTNHRHLDTVFQMP